jgi:mRNA-degrading endonuclease toxin of MazEF toxin-antitoxin module
MIQPGEIYMADVPPGQQHRVVVVSREELNRGKYVIAALITSQKFAIRSALANCVPLRAG